MRCMVQKDGVANERKRERARGERELEEGRRERKSDVCAREKERERSDEVEGEVHKQRGSSLDLYNEEETNRERRKREREKRLAKENKTPRGWCTRIKNEG